MLIWLVNAKGEVIIKHKFQVFTGPVRDLDWSEDGKKLLVVGGGKPFAKLISVDIETSKGEESGHSKCALACSVRQKRPFIGVTGGEDFILGVHKFTPM